MNAMERRGRVMVMAATLLLLAAGSAMAAGGGAMHDRAGNDISNVASLQRGARNFVNYCMGCHSAQYVRYNQLGRDLQISDEQLISNIMFAAAKPTELMEIAMRPGDAERWFGQAPPDLSLIARSRGTDYLYNFLRGFYVDPSKPTGVNNVMLPGTSMPHVLVELQGLRKAVFEEVKHGAGVQTVFTGFEDVASGAMSGAEYDEFVRDLVNFLDYIGEPIKLKRQSLGIPVIAFLLFFGLLAWLLKVEIWKSVR